MQIWTNPILNHDTLNDRFAQRKPDGVMPTESSGNAFFCHYRNRPGNPVDLQYTLRTAKQASGTRSCQSPIDLGIAIRLTDLFHGKISGPIVTQNGSVVLTKSIVELHEAQNVHADLRFLPSMENTGRSGRRLPSTERERKNSTNQSNSRLTDVNANRDQQKKTNQNEKRNVNQRVASRRDSDCDCGEWPARGTLCRTGQSG